MQIFKKRETPVQNIAYMAIMSAINIIFVLITNLLPVMLFLLVLVLPLTSTIVTLYCKKKYYPIYAIATLGLCFAVAGGFYIFDALIYVLPSLIVGFIFGISFEFKLPAILIIVSATIAQFLLTYLTFLILKHIMLNFNTMDSILDLFGLNEFPYRDSFVYVFLYIISQIQIVLSYIFVKVQVKRIGVDINLACKNRYFLYFTTILSILLAVLAYFYFPSWCLVFIIMPIAIYVFEMAELLLKTDILTIVLIVISHITFIFLFAFLYQYTIKPNQLIILTALTGLVTIIDFLSNYCFIKKTK